MTLEELVIGAVRLLGALIVLRFHLAGALLAIAVDFADLFMMGWLDLGGIRDYQRFDKLCDTAYMLTFAWVALRWGGPEARVSAILFTLRMTGLALFAATADRIALAAFPNVFEFWFVYVAARRRRQRRDRGPQGTQAMNRSELVTALAAVTALKLAHEYLLHIDRTLDNYVAIELVEAAWRWVTGRQ